MTALGQVLTLALLHFVWQGALAACALWIALLAMRKRSANTRYAVSCLALAAMILAPTLTVYVLHLRPAAVSGVELAGLSALARASTPLPPTNWLAWLQAWAVPVWCLGVLVFSARLAWGSRQVSLLRRRGEPAGEALVGVASRVASSMGLDRRVGVFDLLAGGWRERHRTPAPRHPAPFRDDPGANARATGGDARE